MTLMEAKKFGFACAAALDTIQTAADPAFRLDTPYYGNRIEVAIYYAKHVVREARKLGLYPDTKQLEIETREAKAA